MTRARCARSSRASHRADWRNDRGLAPPTALGRVSATTAGLAAAAATVPAATNGMGQPAFASNPAITPQTENWEPTEMSICRATITSVIPTATIKTVDFATKRPRR